MKLMCSKGCGRYWREPYDKCCIACDGTGKHHSEHCGKCVKGCGRKRYLTHKRCCRLCNGEDGPHAIFCNEKCISEGCERTRSPGSDKCCASCAGPDGPHEHGCMPPLTSKELFWTEALSAGAAKSFFSSNYYRICSELKKELTPDDVANCLDNVEADQKSWVESMGPYAPIPHVGSLFRECVEGKKPPNLPGGPKASASSDMRKLLALWSAWLWTAPLVYPKITKALLDDDELELRKFCPLLKCICGFLSVGTGEKMDTYRASRSKRDQFKVGDWCRLSMLVASTSEKKVADNFWEMLLQHNAAGSMLHFVIPANCRNAGSVANISWFPWEAEYLLPPYTPVKCIEIKQENYKGKPRDVIVLEVGDSDEVADKFESGAARYVRTQFYRQVVLAPGAKDIQKESDFDEQDLSDILEGLEKAGCKGIQESKEYYLQKTQKAAVENGIASISGHLCEVRKGNPPLDKVHKVKLADGAPEPWECIQKALYADSEDVSYLAPLLRRLRYEGNHSKTKKTQLYRRIRKEFKDDTLKVLSTEGQKGVFSRSFVFCQDIKLMDLNDGDIVVWIEVPDKSPWCVPLTGRGRCLLLPYTIVVVEVAYNAAGITEVEGKPVHMKVNVLPTGAPGSDILDGLQISAA